MSEVEGGWCPPGTPRNPPRNPRNLQEPAGTRQGKGKLSWLALTKRCPRGGFSKSEDKEASRSDCGFWFPTKDFEPWLYRSLVPCLLASLCSVGFRGFLWFPWGFLCGFLGGVLGVPGCPPGSPRVSFPGDPQGTPRSIIPPEDPPRRAPPRVTPPGYAGVTPPGGG